MVDCLKGNNAFHLEIKKAGIAIQLKLKRHLGLIPIRVL